MGFMADTIPDFLSNKAARNDACVGSMRPGINMRQVNGGGERGERARCKADGDKGSVLSAATRDAATGGCRTTLSATFTYLSAGTKDALLNHLVSCLELVRGGIGNEGASKRGACRHFVKRDRRRRFIRVQHGGCLRPSVGRSVG
jgi:hypothetical protein